MHLAVPAFAGRTCLLADTHMHVWHGGLLLWCSAAAWCAAAEPQQCMCQVFLRAAGILRLPREAVGMLLRAHGAFPHTKEWARMLFAVQTAETTLGFWVSADLSLKPCRGRADGSAQQYAVYFCVAATMKAACRACEYTCWVGDAVCAVL